MSTNGAPDFTHQLGHFTLEGHTFRRVKVSSKDWADAMDSLGAAETAEITGESEGRRMIAVSDEGVHKLVLLALHPDDREMWETLRSEGRIEFGELVAIKDWIWEQMTERPFTSATPSLDGPGASGRSSRARSSSQAATPEG